MKLPPLKYLPAFDRVAYHQNFRKAAEELCLSPGALSQQIKNLEQALGVRLLERDTKHVELTQLGKQYLESVRPALSMIAQATDRLKQDDERVVTVKLFNTLAIHWLIPKMTAFQLKHPDIELRLIPMSSDLETGPSEADFTIAYAERPREGVFEPLLPDYLVLIANKKFDGNVREALSHLPVISVAQSAREQDWPLWAKAHDLSVPEFDIKMASTMQAIQAVKAGAGCLVTHRVFIDSDELAYHLNIIGQEVLAPKKYYLVMKEDYRRGSRALVREWLLADS